MAFPGSLRLRRRWRTLPGLQQVDATDPDAVPAMLRALALR